MNDHEKPKQDELREAWIESLLVSAMKPPDHADRIARAMSRLEPGQVAPNPAALGRTRVRFVEWGSVGVAASVLLALFWLLHDGGSQSAMAAIQRSLDVAAEQTTRKYLLQVEYRSADGQTLKTDNDLYVQGNKRLVLRHPSLLLGTSFWLGRNGSESWVVPPLGPVLKGDNGNLILWLRSREELDTPYLHVSTFLTRMSRGYQLETLDDEEVAVPITGPVACQHIRARRISAAQPDLPDTIELWASRESGIAIRLIARWELGDDQIGRKSVLLTYRNEEPSLSEDWFTPERHYQGRRPVMRMDPSDN